MVDRKRDVERLIEDGLIRYGGGDLAGALAAWERALIQDPGNLQAVGYIDYVRRVFDQVTKATQDELVVPFGLGHGESPSYQIDLSPEPPDDDDEVHRSSGPEDGWLIAQDDDRDTVERLYSDPPGTLDLEYDEPEVEVAAAAAMVGKVTRDFSDILTAQDASAHPAQVTGDDDLDAFDGPEQELSAGFLANASVTPGFGEPEVTPGFAEEGQGNATGLRQPQLGFVQPRRPTLERVASSAPAPAQRAVVSTVVRSTTTRGGPGVEPPVPAPAQRSAAEEARETLEVPEPEEAYDNLEMAPFIEELPPSADVADLTSEAGGRPRQESFTRDLGLAGRYVAREEKFGEESPTRELPRHLLEEDEHTQAWHNAPPAKVDPLEALCAGILPHLERDVPPQEARDARLRRRVATLVELAGQWSQVGDVKRAVAAVDLALAEDPDSALAQKLIHRNRDAIMGVFQQFLGSLDRRPTLSRSLDELGKAPLGARAAFLLSRVDGNLTYDEILDVSGMPRLEAYRYLCQLLIRGILSAE